MLDKDLNSVVNGPPTSTEISNFGITPVKLKGCKHHTDTRPVTHSLFSVSKMKHKNHNRFSHNLKVIIIFHKFTDKQITLATTKTFRIFIRGNCVDSDPAAPLRSSHS